MHGLMQHKHLMFDAVLDHAAQLHGQREIVSRSVDGLIKPHLVASERPRYEAWLTRSRVASPDRLGRARRRRQADDLDVERHVPGVVDPAHVQAALVADSRRFAFR